MVLDSKTNKSSAWLSSLLAAIAIIYLFQNNREESLKRDCSRKVPGFKGDSFRLNDAYVSLIYNYTL